MEKRFEQRVKKQKADHIEARIREIKSTNQVINLSSMEVPDDVYLYLSLGSTFVPHRKPSDHDLIYDTKSFCRNLSWQTYFHSNPPESTNSNHLASEDRTANKIDFCAGIEKLRPPGSSWPVYNNKLLEDVNRKLTHGISEITKTTKDHITNLTHREADGLKWCQKNTKDRKCYITRADKGGAILILDATKVDEVIMENLQNSGSYSTIAKDPRADTRKELIALLKSAVDMEVIPRKVLHYITGVIEHDEKNDGFSHSHVFRIAIPYIYPLFKIHKLSLAAIQAKTIPPTRMVTGSTNGPTFRLGLFVDSVLQPIARGYCAPEMVKDTTTFISYVEANRSVFESEARYVCNLDVVALFPSIPKDKALIAIEHALNYLEVEPSQRDFIIEIVKFSINHSFIQYRGNWYSSENGIPTGGPDSGCIANIFVKWFFTTHLLPSSEVEKHNYTICRKRFLDDIFSLWKGTPRQYDMFLAALNMIGRPFGIGFTGSCGKAIEFLDVLIDISSGRLRTKLYVKPTDSPTYLNRRSYHNKHTFKSLPVSQFRRAIVICSEPEDQLEAIDYMYHKFVKCGYSEEELNVAKAKALSLNRQDMLKFDNTDVATPPDPVIDSTSKSIVFISTYSCYTSPLKQLVQGMKTDIKTLIGHDKIIFANKKNPNTASLLFCKASFAQQPKEIKSNQKCGAKKCMSCPIMTLPREIVYNGLKIKLDFSLNCKSEDIIYIARCQHHDASRTDNRLVCIENNQCYFGQTCNECRKRMNGHRNCFKFDNNNYEKSALSMHIFSDHVTKFGDKLNNYELGIIKQVKSDIYGLNRYKVTK